MVGKAFPQLFPRVLHRETSLYWQQMFSDSARLRGKHSTHLQAPGTDAAINYGQNIFFVATFQFSFQKSFCAPEIVLPHIYQLG